MIPYMNFVFSMYETLNPIGFIDGKPYDRRFWDTVEFSHQRLDLKKSGAPRLSANGFRQRVSKTGWVGWLVGSLLPVLFLGQQKEMQVFFTKYLEGDS